MYGAFSLWKVLLQISLTAGRLILVNYYDRVAIANLRQSLLGDLLLLLLARALK